ncbi:hypothetical protein Rhal01_03319 [Rubritalea halochordaticola]|uniref:Uncharacterized protein n=1 Tax=Rubritalea halochordaticola TaxID=714537 RepID=A0ABP9V390_9BACT
MGLEYKLICRDFNTELYDQLIDKILSVVEPECVSRSGGDIEVRFEREESEMPDLAIQRTSEPREFIFLYNGGTMRSWSIFGILISYLSQYSQSVIVEEI